MKGEREETLQCVDCGISADQASISLHPSAVSAPADEGHIRHTRVPLCNRCADLRLAAQEPNFV